MRHGFLPGGGARWGLALPGLVFSRPFFNIYQKTALGCPAFLKRAKLLRIYVFSLKQMAVRCFSGPGMGQGLLQNCLQVLPPASGQKSRMRAALLYSGTGQHTSFLLHHIIHPGKAAHKPGSSGSQGNPFSSCVQGRPGGRVLKSGFEHQGA